MSVFAELKRRNVVKVGVAYLIVAWVLAQVAGLLLPAFEAPPWVFRVIVLLLAIGFVISLFVAWVYELTPEGVKHTEDVPKAQSITHATSQKLNFVIIAALALALVLVVLDSYVLTGGGAASTADATAGEAAAMNIANAIGAEFSLAGQNAIETPLTSSPAAYALYAV